VPLACENCGRNAFRLRRAVGGAEAECINWGKVIPNAVLRAATKPAPLDESASGPGGTDPTTSGPGS
jgi:hypothetical protein